MTQSQLPLSPRAKVAHHAVPESSREAYHSMNGHQWNRAARVTGALRSCGLELTAAELLHRQHPTLFNGSAEWKVALLEVRRGLSDARDQRWVIACAARPCQITGRKVIAWRLAKS